jgi:hypothetical protein
MSSSTKTRLTRLERSLEIELSAMFKQSPPGLFEATYVSAEDSKVLDAIFERGEPLKICTAEEQAAADRLAAEYKSALQELSK